jgi:hypothetical protein
MSSPIKLKSLCARTGRLNRTEIQSLIDDLAVNISLYPKRADYTWHPGVPQTRLAFAVANRRMRHLKRARKIAPPEVNSRGNRVDRAFRQTSSYYFATLLAAQGFQQYETSQDASWFGVWVNLKVRTVFTFAEGDCITVTCPTKENFIAELEYLASAYGPAPAFMRAFDDDGVVTRYIAKRPGAELLAA